MTDNQEKSSLRKIPNVGSQTEQDLIAMGYTSVESLKGKKAEDLYEEECRLRGCTIDRCQLYLYRALEYFVHTENPDSEKCKWWYWKDDYFYPSPCGARCVDCASFPKECKGCRKIKGKRLPNAKFSERPEGRKLSWHPSDIRRACQAGKHTLRRHPLPAKNGTRVPAGSEVFRFRLYGSEYR